MSDIVERLRRSPYRGDTFTLCQKAADEIDGLRAELAKAKTNFEEMGEKFLQAKFEAAKTRNASLEEAAKLAEADFRSDLTRKAGHIPSWLDHGRRIAAAIRALREEE